MIKITRIRLKEVKMELPDRVSLCKLRGILVKYFGTTDILFEYEDDGKGVAK